MPKFDELINEWWQKKAEEEGRLKHISDFYRRIFPPPGVALSAIPSLSFSYSYTETESHHSIRIFGLLFWRQ